MEMCTIAEGEEMKQIFFKYYNEREISSEDKPVLDKLFKAAFVDYRYRDGKAYAEASPMGKCLEPPRKRSPLF